MAFERRGKAPEDMTLEDFRAVWKARVDVKFTSVFASGFAYDFGGSYGTQRLQTRNDGDKVAWLTSQAAYAAAIAVGAGDVAGAKFRSADNVNIVVTFTEGHQILLDMAAWGAAVYERAWTLKDEIAAAVDRAELDAININEGWPT